MKKTIERITSTAILSVAFMLSATSAWAAGEPAILDDAYLWLDASTLVGSAGDEVASWASRNAGGKTASTTGTKPTIATINGRKVVDFGAAGSGMDLTFDRTTTIRAVFMVADVEHDGRVFLLGDSNNYQFHRGTQGQYYNENYNFTSALNDGTYRDGIKVDNPRTTHIPTGFGLITLVANANVAACNICQDRNQSGRNGGKKIAELIIFNKTLTDAERGQVEEYLMDKWLKSRATISSGTNWGDIAWEDASLSESSISYEVNVPSTAENTVNLTLNAALTSAKEIIFNVASGKKLIISGNNVPSCQFYIKGEGTVSTAKTQIFGTTPKVKVSYPAVWELTNSEDDTSDRGVDCSNITGDGTIRMISSGNYWRTLPWGDGKMWANTLGLDTMEQNGVIISEGDDRLWEIGSLSGSCGIRSDYGANSTSGGKQRKVRFTQSRNTTWSGKFHNDRIDDVYVAGAAGAIEKTLTIDSGAVDADNPLTVESSGSVKLTGKWKGNLTVKGEFGGSGFVQNATAISIASGATLRADWGATTFNVKPTFAEGIVNVIVSSLPEKDIATKIISGSSFAAGTYNNSYAIVKTADGTSKACAAISAQADGVYVTVTDAATYAVLSSRPKYAYELNGSYASSGETEMTMSGGSIDAGDYAAAAVLKLGSNAGSHYSSGGFSYSTDYNYTSGDWTLVTYVMAPGANQTILSLAGASGTQGMIGLRHAGNNQVKAFTASSTDLTGVTLSSDPTAGFHLYAIVYTASDGKVKMSVDGGEFTEGVAFTPGNANSWQFGGIYQGEVAAFAANATSGQMDSFRFYSVALTQADLSALLTSDYATVAKIGDNNFPTLGVAVADRASAETVVEVVADCAETAEVALTQNLVLTVANGNSYTIYSAISGAFSVTKQGDGELTLAGANTYSGGTTVSAGVLKRYGKEAFGASGSNVYVCSGGSVDLANGWQGSNTYAYHIAGSGFGGNPAMMMSSSAATLNHSVASLTLDGDATIGGNGNITLGLDSSSYTWVLNLGGHELTKVGSGTMEVYNFTVSGSGTLEVQGGTLTARKYNNQGLAAKLIVGEGATYNTNFEDVHADRFRWYDVENNGTINAGSNSLYVLHSYTGGGSINNLCLTDGATVKLADEGAIVSVSGTLTVAGYYGVDISGLDLSSKSAGDKVKVMTALSAFDVSKVSAVLRGSNSSKWNLYAEVDAENAETYILGVELGDLDSEITWDGSSGTWSSASFNGLSGVYGDGAGQVIVFADATESSSDAISVTVDGEKTVPVISFTAEDRDITLMGDAISVGRISKSGGAVATIKNALTITSSISVTDGVLVINPTEESVPDAAELDDGTLVVYVGSGNTTTISIPITATKLIKRGAGTLDLTAISPSIPMVIDAGKVVADDTPTGKVTINENGTFELKDCGWTGSGDVFAGAGTLYLNTRSGFSSNRIIHDVSGATFSGILKIGIPSDKQVYFNGNPASQLIGRPALTLECGTENSQGQLWVGALAAGKNFNVKNLSGWAYIVPWSNTAGIHYFDTLQIDDTTFSGSFKDWSGSAIGRGNFKTGLTVKGDSVLKSLTLAAANETTGPLEIQNNGKVIFSSSGSWLNGTTTVKAGGVLESQRDAQVVGNLTLEDCSTLSFAEGYSLQVGAITLPASGTVTLDVTDLTIPAEGYTLISGTELTDADCDKFSIAAGSGKYYALVPSATGLHLHNAVAADSISAQSPKFYASVARALEEQDTVYLINPPNETVTLNVGKTIINILGVDVSNLTVNAPTSEYVSPLAANAGGNYSVANAVNAAATYYWIGAPDSAWSTVGNWAVGAVDGPIATRAVTSIDSVVFNDGATVTLDANTTVAGIAVNGAVSISGSAKSLNTSGNITGTGTLTLNDICLASVGAELTVAPNINFTNDSELARVTSGNFIINGNITASGTFKVWDVTHTVNGNLSIASGANMAIGSALVVNGTTTFNGDFSKSQNGTLTIGNVVVAENTSITAGSGSIAITGTVSPNSGKSLAIPASNVTYSSATFTGSGAVSFGAVPAAALNFSSWTGTVVLPYLNSIAGDTFSFNSYGIEGSTVRVSGIGGGWLKNEEVNPTIDIPEGVTLTISDFSPSFNNTFKALSGAGTFAVTYNTAIDTTSGSWYSNYSAYFLVKNVSNFTGSLSTATPGIAIGSAKPEYKTAGGKIRLETSATIATTKTWTATDGIELANSDATLTNTDGELNSPPTTNVSHSRVKTVTVDGTTTYSVELIPGTTFTVY